MPSTSASGKKGGSRGQSTLASVLCLLNSQWLSMYDPKMEGGTAASTRYWSGPSIELIGESLEFSMGLETIDAGYG